MEKKQFTEKEQFIRVLLLWMPAVAILLLTTSFGWAGGGKGHPALAAATGLLKRLPGPFVGPITRLDKMGYYELAKRDSIALRQRLTIQSNYARQLGLDADKPKSPLLIRDAVFADSSVARIQQKLAALKRATRPDAHLIATSPSFLSHPPAPSRDPDISRYQQAIRLLEHDEGGKTELHEINSVVEKLLTLQRSQTDTTRRTVINHPPTPVTRSTLTVLALPDEEDTIGRFDSSRIEAIIPEETILVSGSQLRLQLVRDIQVGSNTVPAGTPIFGIATLSGERLRIAIDAIVTDGHFLTVNLDVEDQDGMPGIYIPGVPISEALRESAGQELGSLGSGVISTTLAGQAAGAGVALARSLIGKKIRPVRVTIPAGYHVYLHVKNAPL